MTKTDRIKVMDILKIIDDLIAQERVSLNIYGTTNEDSYLSGINEGLDRARDAVRDFDLDAYLKENA